MAKVLAGMTMSLDGFVEDRHGSVARLYPDLDAMRQPDLQPRVPYCSGHQTPMLPCERAMQQTSSRLRLGIATISPLTIALGVWAGGLIQVGGLLVLFVIMLSWEHAAAKLASRDVAQEPQGRDRMEVR
jgi:hypothetical protein